MQIAKMFASLGFNVDVSGLNEFKKHLRDARADTATLSRNFNVLKQSINKTTDAIVRLNKNLAIKKTDNKLSDGYEKFSKAIEKTEKALLSIAKNQDITTKSLGKIHGSIIFGETKWTKYADSVQRTKDLLKGANAEMKSLRNNSSVTAKVTTTTNRTTSSSPTTHQPTPKTQNNTTIIPVGGFGKNMTSGSWLGGAGQFFRSMTPSVAIGSGLGAMGYAVKEIVQGGREMQKMQNIMTSATENQKEYANAMEYVRSESNRLGQDTREMGMGFAKVLQSASGKMSIEKTKKLFTGFGELMTVFGSSVEDQQGVYRAIGQMLSKGKVEAEEVGQLAERGISREYIKRAAMKTYKLKDGQYEAYQKAGKVKIPEIADELAKILSEQANKNNALEKALNNSRVAQQRFNNALNELKLKILEGGLDQALAKLFNVLTDLTQVGKELIDIFQALAKYARKLKESVSSLNGETVIFIGTIAALLPLLFKKKKSIFDVNSNLSILQKTTQAYTRFINTRLVSALVKVAGRFAFLGTVIYQVYKLGSQLTEEDNWLDLLTLQFSILALRAENAFLRIKYAWKELMMDSQIGRNFLMVQGLFKNGVENTIQNAVNPNQNNNGTPQGKRFVLTPESKQKVTEYFQNSTRLLPQLGQVFERSVQGGNYVDPSKKIILEIKDTRTGKTTSMSLYDATQQGYLNIGGAP